MKKPAATVVLVSILSLFFFQQLTDFIAAVYALGLLGTNVPPEIASVAFLLSPFILLFFRKRPGVKIVAVLAVAAIACRMAEPFLPTRLRMVVSGLGTGVFLFIAPLGLAAPPAAAALGLSLGLALSNLLRALGSGLDLSTLASGWPVGAVLSIAAAIILFSLPAAADSPEAAAPARGNFGKTLAFAVGMAAAAAMLYFAFTAVNVVSRWADLPYPLVAALAFLALALFALVYALPAARERMLARGVLVCLNVLFLASLAAGLFLYSVRLPTDPSAFPFSPPSTPGWEWAPLSLCVLLFPVLIADIAAMARGLQESRPSPRAMGGAFGVASLVLLLLVFAHVFTTVYDYIPVVGPLFRDRFWLVSSAAALIAMLPLLLLPARRPSEEARAPRSTLLVAPALALIGLAAVVWIFASEPRPSASPGASSASATGPLRVLTYNIQQGYSAGGERNYDGQLAVMLSADADVIGLQETDSNRISGGNDDLVRYLSRRLGMYSVYGPPVTAGTFGIALLSRLPIQDPHVFYMYSSGEQTAAITARVTKDGRRYTLLVTHLGNDGPMIQLRQVLSGAAGLENLIAMGDFNFKPSTPQHLSAVALFADAWEIGRSVSADPAFDLAGRIDYMFLADGLSALSAKYSAVGASDHPALLVDIGR